MRFIEGPVRWGIIGCGDVCEVKSGPAFSRVPGSSLAAVMRRDDAKAKDFARRHNVAAWYRDASALINDSNVNAVYIATPPESHEQYAIESMHAGKPVYIEKPVTTTSKACEGILKASIEMNIPVAVAHYRRELDLFKRVRELVIAGGIGKIRMITLRLFHASKADGPDKNWRVNPTLSGGGLLFDLGPHQLDILYWIFGKPESFTTYSINQGRLYQAPDITSISGVFGNDVFFQGLWSFNAPLHERCDSCTIMGDTGSVEFPFFSSFEKATLSIDKGGQLTKEEFIFPRHIQEPMIEQVVGYFQGKRDNPCALDEALVTLQMIEQSQKI